jgi:hypothetical protein
MSDKATHWHQSATGYMSRRATHWTPYSYWIYVRYVELETGHHVVSQYMSGRATQTQQHVATEYISNKATHGPPGKYGIYVHTYVR